MEEEGITGGEFVSLINLIVNAQTKLKNLDNSNELLKCNVKINGTGLSYSPEFSGRYNGRPLNTALEAYYLNLNTEINRVKNA